MATINSVSLGIVKNESSSKESNLFYQPTPGDDSEDAILIDIFGTGRTITVSGKFIGNKTALQTYVSNIESIQNGQQELVVYAGEIITKNVQIQSFSWDYKEGSPNEIDYTLTLLEGGS